MEVIYLLVPLSLMFISVAIYVFFLAIKSEQFDDLEGPAHRVVMDDQNQRRADARTRDVNTPTVADKTQDANHD